MFNINSLHRGAWSRGGSLFFALVLLATSVVSLVGIRQAEAANITFEYVIVFQNGQTRSGFSRINHTVAANRIDGL